MQCTCTLGIHGYSVFKSVSLKAVHHWQSPPRRSAQPSLILTYQALPSGPFNGWAPFGFAASLCHLSQQWQSQWKRSYLTRHTVIIQCKHEWYIVFEWMTLFGTRTLRPSSVECQFTRNCPPIKRRHVPLSSLHNVYYGRVIKTSPPMHIRRPIPYEWWEVNYYIRNICYQLPR